MKDEVPFPAVAQPLSPPYKGFTSTPHFIPMRDGVHIALDVLLPKGLPSGTKLPTILIQTRYWRAMDVKPPVGWFLSMPTNPGWCKHMVKYGYALATVDTRGTGASEGTRLNPLSMDEILDGKDIIDWVTTRPWSNGNVVTWGNSYTAMTGECAISLNHPAIKGGNIRHPVWDFYTDAFMPGGVYNEGFVHYWSALGKALDTTKGKALAVLKNINPMFKVAPLIIRGVKPVTSRDDLARVAKIHEKNKYTENYGDWVTYKDDGVPPTGQTIEEVSVHAHRKGVEDSGVPLYTWASWWDSNTVDTVLRRFLTYSNPQKGIIGDWDHAGHFRASPFFSPKAKSIMSTRQNVEEWVNFFDDCIAGRGPGTKVVYYYTMGEERWKRTTTWPPKGQQYRPWYFSGGHGLSLEKPVIDAAKDEYAVDFDHTTGIRNRWYTLLTLPVDYTKHDSKAMGLLTYTSPPLDDEIEITGHPILHLHVSSTHDDGIIMGFLEMVDAGSGEANFITEGQIRLLHRKVSPEGPFPFKVPHDAPHTFLKKDGAPMVPGKVEAVRFALYPTSIRIPAGKCLRVGIAGADKDSFRRLPESGTPVLSVARDKDRPSCIELPIIS